ncbi:hypothetical protein QBE52_06325 [Clostridiaceae bacterium 35-E11]
MKRNKSMMIFVILIIILIGVNGKFQILDKSIGKNNKNQAALPLNTSYQGVSIFYDTLKNLGYSVKIDAENFLEKRSEDIYIITENENPSGFNLKEAERWINQGGKLVYLTDRYKEYTYADSIDQYKEQAYFYTLGKGKLLVGDIHLITNKTLLKEKEGAYYIFDCIDQLEGKIYFNEYHGFLQGEMPSLYKNIPFPIKILLLQLLLVLIGSIIYFGKRFGKAKRIMEEIERDENEYLYAAANFYEKGGCMDTIYDHFYDAFQNELKRTFKISTATDRWLDLWEKHNLPDKEQAMRIFYYERERKNKNSKETFSIIKDMDQLIQMLMQRREVGWKRLKQKHL